MRRHINQTWYVRLGPSAYLTFLFLIFATHLAFYE